MHSKRKSKTSWSARMMSKRHLEMSLWLMPLARVNLDETEIDYAADLYVGVNPWTKGSLSNGHENNRS